MKVFFGLLFLCAAVFKLYNAVRFYRLTHEVEDKKERKVRCAAMMPKMVVSIAAFWITMVVYNII